MRDTESRMPERVRVIDSHTGGEPTRVIVEGGPDLGAGPLAERARRLREEQDLLRRGVCLEPRGHDAVVGAILTPPHEPGCVAGVIFFNNVSTLHMCVHGTIGVVATLAHLGRISPGRHRLDTPVGVVEASWEEGGEVAVANVPSFRHRSGVAVEVPGWGVVTGDIAWGGNWFFLIDGQGPPVRLAERDALTRFTAAVRAALAESGITGADGGEIDHIEVFGPPHNLHEDSRNFVLCPGLAYDRSPCGTGTSAKLACLHAAGKLAPGARWRQGGIVGSVFTGTCEPLPDGKVLPTIRGRAWVTAESVLLFHHDDPFRAGIAPEI